LDKNIKEKTKTTNPKTVVDNFGISNCRRYLGFVLSLVVSSLLLLLEEEVVVVQSCGKSS